MPLGPQSQEPEAVPVRTVSGIQLSLKAFQPADASNWHRHDGAYGCLMLSGDVLEQRVGAEGELGPGDCTFRPPRARHRFRCGPEGAKVLTFEIPESRLVDLLENGCRIRGYRFLRSGTITVLGHVLRAGLEREEFDGQLTLESTLLDLLAEAADPFSDPGLGAPPRWVARVRERLHDETDRRLSLAELADEAGVHPIHLARTFRRHYGQPVGAYHRRLRLDRALRELVESDKSLIEIALAAGFYDQSHFSNVVVGVAGTSPARLRSLCRSASPEEL